jgi:hypothetical protein
MRRMKNALLLVCVLGACDGSDELATDAGSGDGGSVPAMITITGQAAEVSGSGLDAMVNLPIAAYDRDDEVTPIATTTSDSLGNYTLTIPTSGKPFDGFIKAQPAGQGYVDTYVYLPGALSASFDGAPVRVATAFTLGLLDDFCASSQVAGNGTLVAIATDAAHTPVAGVTFSTTPAANKYCYNGQQGQPDSVQLTTATDGVGYMFNVTGPTTLSAMKTGATFTSRSVTVRPDVVTLVMIAP